MASSHGLVQLRARAGNRAVARVLSARSGDIQRLALSQDTWDHIALGGWSVANNRPVGYHWTGLGDQSFIEQVPDAPRIDAQNRKAYQTDVRLRADKRQALETHLQKKGDLKKGQKLPGTPTDKTKKSTFFPDRWREADLRLTITSAKANQGAQDYTPEKGAGAEHSFEWQGDKIQGRAMILNTNDESVYPKLR